MPPPADLTVNDALETLVNQFSDRLSFLRELIQNSLDAGSPEMDVRVDFEPDDSGDRGTVIITVDDFGEGMDASIIDTRLTRLFSSGKDGDYTKIGRFGIGFVSVFAIEPDAVCVDTARGGEAWRVLFNRDRTFQRIALDTPVDGTVIRVFKKASREEADALTKRAREVVVYWCKHAAAEIRFQGEPINQQLEVRSPCSVRFEEEGTEVVAGFSRDETPFHGFYNRGLTLHEANEPLVPYITFKANSRYLEHTLTRDNVLRDANFDKLIKIVERLRDAELPRLLFDQLEEHVRAGRNDDSTNELYRFAANWVVARQRDTYKLFRDWKFEDKVVLPRVDGALLTLGDCIAARTSAPVYFDPTLSACTRALGDAGHLVARCRPNSGAYAFLAAVTGRQPLRASRQFAVTLPVEDADKKSSEALGSAVARLLDASGSRVKGVALRRFRYPASIISDRVAVTQAEPGELTPREELGELSTSLFSRGRWVVLNADHPTVDRLVQLACHEPEFAAYTLAKLLHLRTALTPETDGQLCAIAWERRCRRQRRS